MDSETVLRWGIISCGRISNDFALSVYRLNSPRHKLVAAAARSSAKSAEDFAKRFKMPKFYGNYDALYADPDINAVYIGNLISDHLEAALKAIDAGKAVLVEKSMTTNSSDCRRIFEAARNKGVLVMEALWSRFNPVYGRLRQLLSGENALKPAAVNVNFTIPIENVERIAKPELGGGAMLDIGIYPLQLSTFIFQGKKPTKVLATGHKSKLGVELAASVALEFDNGGHAALCIDARAGHPMICEARIVFFPGSEFVSAKIHSPFWAPTKLELCKADGSVVVEDYPIYPELDTSDGLNFEFYNSQALAYEAEGFADVFEKWQKTRSDPPTATIEHPYRAHSDTLLDFYIMEQIKAQVLG